MSMTSAFSLPLSSFPSPFSLACSRRSDIVAREWKILFTSACSQYFLSCATISTPGTGYFLFRVVLRLIGIIKPSFERRSGENGQICRSHLFKNPARNTSKYASKFNYCNIRPFFLFYFNIRETL